MAATIAAITDGKWTGMRLMSPTQSGLYWARRVVETPRTFTNWPQVFRDMALGRSGRGPAELTFKTRTGITINTPNRPGARVLL